MPMFTTSVKRCPGGAALAAVMHRGDEGPHAVPFGYREIGGIIDAARLRGAQPAAGRRAQRHVHRRAMLGGVHRLAGEQPGAKRIQLGRFGQREQRLQRFVVDRRFAEIQRQVVEAGAEPAGAVRRGGEQRSDAATVRSGGERGQASERGGAGG